MQKAETARLILREFKMEDVAELFKMESNPEVLRYLHTPPMESLEIMKANITRVQGEYEKFGTARLVIEEKTSGEVIGWAGLKFINYEINNHSDYYDVGYRLRKASWGKGYATEAAIASVEYGFKDLGLTEIHAMADVENGASNKILTKIGMSRLNEFDYKGVSHYFYIIKNL